jgi:hypothetical protein
MSLGYWLFECDIQWCHWGADCLNVKFRYVTGALNVWMWHSVMSLGCWLFECDIQWCHRGCWLFECDVQWCHWGADCLNITFNYVTGALFECYIQLCYWSTDCLNVMFTDVTEMLTVSRLHSFMSLGCWLFECDVKWCHCWNWRSHISWCYNISCNT